MSEQPDELCHDSHGFGIPTPHLHVDYPRDCQRCGAPLRPATFEDECSWSAPDDGTLPVVQRAYLPHEEGECKQVADLNDSLRRITEEVMLELSDEDAMGVQVGVFKRIVGSAVRACQRRVNRSTTSAPSEPRPNLQDVVDELKRLNDWYGEELKYASSLLAQARMANDSPQAWEDWWGDVTRFLQFGAPSSVYCYGPFESEAVSGPGDNEPTADEGYEVCPACKGWGSGPPVGADGCGTCAGEGQVPKMPEAGADAGTAGQRRFRVQMPEPGKPTTAVFDDDAGVKQCGRRMTVASGTVHACKLDRGHEGNHRDIDTGAGWDERFSDADATRNPTDPPGPEFDAAGTRHRWCREHRAYHPDGGECVGMAVHDVGADARKLATGEWEMPPDDLLNQAREFFRTEDEARAYMKGREEEHGSATTDQLRRHPNAKLWSCPCGRWYSDAGPGPEPACPYCNPEAFASTPSAVHSERDLMRRLYNSLFGYAIKDGSVQALRDAEAYLNIPENAGESARTADGPWDRAYDADGAEQ